MLAFNNNIEGCIQVRQIIIAIRLLFEQLEMFDFISGNMIGKLQKPNKKNKYCKRYNNNKEETKVGKLMLSIQQLE